MESSAHPPTPFVPPPRSALAFGAQLFVKAAMPASDLSDAVLSSLQRFRARSYAEHVAALAAAARRRSRVALRARADADEAEDDREASTAATAPMRVAGWRSDSADLAAPDNAAAWLADEEPDDVAQARQGALARDVTDVSGEAFFGRPSQTIRADAAAAETEGALSALRRARKEAEAREDDEDQAIVAAAVAAGATLAASSGTPASSDAVVQLLNSICAGLPAADAPITSSLSLHSFPGSSASMSALAAKCSFGGAEPGPSSVRPGRARRRCADIACREAEIAASDPASCEGERRHQLWAAASEAFDCDEEGPDFWTFHPLGARLASRFTSYFRVRGDAASALLVGDVTADSRRAAQINAMGDMSASPAPALGALLRRQLAAAGLPLLAVEAAKAAAVVAASSGPYAAQRDTRVLSSDGKSPRGHLGVERSLQSAAICSVCEVVVRGMSLTCPVCGHGGHESHIRGYFFDEDKCASGCGCACLEGGGLAGVMKRAQAQYHDDSSRAVSGDAPSVELASARYVEDEDEMAAYAS